MSFLDALVARTLHHAYMRLQINDLQSQASLTTLATAGMHAAISSGGFDLTVVNEQLRLAFGARAGHGGRARI